MMRKKGIGFFIALLLLTVLSFSVPASAGSKSKRPVLNRKKILLRKDKKVRLKVKNAKKKVKWSVTGKNILKWKAKGKRKQILVIRPGRRSGKCWVIAKIGRKKLKCRVIVKIPPKGKKKPALSPEPVPEDKPVFVENDFTRAMIGSGLDLLQNTADPARKENILISPDSIVTAVSMAQQGAGGDTRKEMETALGGLASDFLTSGLADFHGNLQNCRNISYTSANSIWYRQNLISLKSSYLEKLSPFYQNSIYPVPFDENTAREMNHWVSEATRGKITSIADRISNQVQMVLLNAVYFKGEWMEPYGNPEKEIFTNADGTVKKVNMLKSSESVYLSLKGGEGFIKKYKGGDTAFLALLPPKGMPAEDYICTISKNDYISAYKERKTSGILVQTQTPEFRYDYEKSLKNTLIRMGMNKAFSDQADFSAMTDYPLCIDDIMHKSYINLDQYGTEAAAVTAVITKSSAAFHPNLVVKKVYLNRPFVYGIIDEKTGVPLFLGIINQL